MPRSTPYKYPRISDDPEVQQRYVECRQAGSSHSLAEMLAMKKSSAYHNHMSPMHPRHNRGRGR